MAQKKRTNAQRKPAQATPKPQAADSAAPADASATPAAPASKRTSRKEAAQAAAKRKQQLRLIIGGVAVALIVVVVAIFLNRPSADGVQIDYDGIDSAPSHAIASLGTAVASPSAEGLIAQTAGFSVGSVDAPVTFHIYSDFQCHYCLNWHEDQLPNLVKDYVRTGQVRLVFHEFPRLGTDQSIADADDLTVELRDPNNESSLAAQAAMCAGEQDEYLSMSDKLFGNYGGVQAGAYRRANLNRFAEDLGLDMDAFNTCMDSEKYIPYIAADLEEGMANGVTATPMFILDNGSGSLNVVQNTGDYDLLRKTIDVSIETAQ